MKTRLQVLHLEDSTTDAELIRSALNHDGFECEVVYADSEETFIAALARTPFDIILADHTLPSFDGVSALAIANERSPNTPFIFVSGTMGEDLAIDCLKAGATDYVLKQRLRRLGPAIRRALDEAQVRAERREAEDT